MVNFVQNLHSGVVGEESSEQKNLGSVETLVLEILVMIVIEIVASSGNNSQLLELLLIVHRSWSTLADVGWTTSPGSGSCHCCHVYYTCPVLVWTRDGAEAHVLFEGWAGTGDAAVHETEQTELQLLMSPKTPCSS